MLDGPWAVPPVMSHAVGPGTVLQLESCPPGPWELFLDIMTVIAVPHREHKHPALSSCLILCHLPQVACTHVRASAQTCTCAHTTCTHACTQHAHNTTQHACCWGKFLCAVHTREPWLVHTQRAFSSAYFLNTCLLSAKAAVCCHEEQGQLPVKQRSLRNRSRLGLTPGCRDPSGVGTLQGCGLAVSVHITVMGLTAEGPGTASARACWPYGPQRTARSQPILDNLGCLPQHCAAASSQAPKVQVLREGRKRVCYCPGAHPRDT